MRGFSALWTLQGHVTMGKLLPQKTSVSIYSECVAAVLTSAVFAVLSFSVMIPSESFSFVVIGESRL